MTDRQYAASIARKYFSGEIAKYQVLEDFPNYESDFKINLLYYRIMNKPKRSWLFGVSNKKYEKYMKEAYEIIEDLETDKLRFKTMKRLLEELWLQSNNCSEPIEHVWFPIQEVAKSTSNSREEIRSYLNVLIENNIIHPISTEPLLLEFTESGKKIKTDDDIEKLLKNIA